MTNFLITLQAMLTDRIDRKDDEGATAVEYGLMVALIAVAILVTVGLLGKGLDGLFQQVLDAINGI